MKIFLSVLPVIFLIIASYLYRHLGKRELLKMDLIQFIYAFVISPIIIIWLKTVVFFNIGNGLGITDPESRFLIDTALTTVMIYIYAFIVIHSLTKTFAIKKEKDPLIDIFEHSEYFHLWLSHFVIFSGMNLILLLIGLVNINIPIQIFTGFEQLYLALTTGLLVSLIFYNAIINYNVKNKDKFTRVIKLEVYICIFILIIGYIIFRPKFSPEFALYWLSITFFIAISTKLNLLKNEPKNRLQLFKSKITKKITDIISL